MINLFSFKQNVDVNYYYNYNYYYYFSSHYDINDND
jgi:hypothetical protein